MRPSASLSGPQFLYLWNKLVELDLWFISSLTDYCSFCRTSRMEQVSVQTLPALLPQTEQLCIFWYSVLGYLSTKGKGKKKSTLFLRYSNSKYFLCCFLYASHHLSIHWCTSSWRADLTLCIRMPLRSWK